LKARNTSSYLCGEVLSLLASTKPIHTSLHRDPFDRLLVAQARHLRLRIVTSAAQIARYEVETLLV